jgi:hypothetical protein
MATAAKLSNPSGLDLDAAGNIYIADQYNQRIRMVSPTGIITTIVGNGIAAYGGDGGSPLLASINYSNGVSVSPTGTIYISDNNNHRIRKVISCLPTTTTQPVNDTVTTGDTAFYTTTTTIPGAIYQWQENPGSGFADLSDITPYSGVHSNTLIISGATVSLNNYRYRCIINSETGCGYITDSALLVVNAADTTDTITTRTISFSRTQNVHIYPNPANSILHIDGLTAITDFQVFDLVGKVQRSGVLDRVSNSVDIHNLSAGIYFIELNQPGCSRLLQRVVVLH